NDELFELGCGDARDGATRQHAMGNIGVDVGCSVLQQGIGRVDEGATRVDDVVHQDAGVTGDISDDVNNFRFAGTLAPFVDDGKWCIDAGRKLACAHHAANIWRHHHEPAEIEAFTHVTHHHGRGE